MIQPASNEASFLNSFSRAFFNIHYAHNYGQQVGRTVNRVIMVSCDFDWYTMKGVEYAARNIKGIDNSFSAVSPTSFINMPKHQLNTWKVLIIFLSETGTTPNIVKAAKYVIKSACQKLVITEDLFTSLAFFNYDAYFFENMLQAF
jgi:fructoselysine-6-P-deglycase FrlB-like protein